MVDVSNKSAYVKKFSKHLKEMSESDAVKHHVGGIENYYIVGAIERRLMEGLGLGEQSYVIDLGCGSGRLAQALAGKAGLRFLGVDVVPDLIAYCRRELRKDWRFEVSDDFTIPEKPGKADYVTAFSLFTHLLDEQTFAYMRDAHRVLKPGGELVFSFLEYRIPAHQKLFLNAEKSKHVDRPLIVFSDREGLTFFASELGFEAPTFIDGSKPYVTFEQPEPLPDGQTISGTKAFGQSVCILRKPL